MDSPLKQPLQGWIEAIGRPRGIGVFQCREVNKRKITAKITLLIINCLFVDLMF